MLNLRERDLWISGSDLWVRTQIDVSHLIVSLANWLSGAEGGSMTHGLRRWIRFFTLNDLVFTLIVL